MMCTHKYQKKETSVSLPKHSKRDTSVERHKPFFMDTLFTYKIPRALSGERADKTLRQALLDKHVVESELEGRSFLTTLFEAGRVRVGGKAVTAGKRLRSGEILEFSVPETTIQPKNEPPIWPEKIYENEYLMVFHKPAFMAMHGGVGIRQTEYTFTDYLLAHYPELATIGESSERPGIVHRLDKDTSGIVLVAKTDEAYLGLKTLFLERKIRKTYIALCYGLFKEKHGIIDFPIRRQRTTLKRAIVRSKTEKALEGAKEAVTEYTVLESFTDTSLVLLKPRTGRMHQIRVHLQALHKAILGDTLYATRDALKAYPHIKRQMLHALRLEFDLFGTQYSFEVMPGKDFEEALQSLDGFQGSGYDYEALKSLFSLNRE